MKSCIVVLLMVVWCADGRGQSPDEVFQAANRLYQDGRFEEAKDRYEAILANGSESSDLYLNLGNACFRMGNIAGAIVNYERGLRLSPEDEDLRFNRELAGMMTIDRIETTPRLFIWDYWDGLKSSFSLTGVFWFGYTAYVLVFVCLSILLLAETYAIRRIALFGSVLAALVFVLFCTIGVERYSDLSREDQGVIMAEITSVKNSPDASSSDAFVLHAGTPVQINDRIGTWIQIRLADGKVGWIDEAAVEVI